MSTTTTAAETIAITHADACRIADEMRANAYENQAEAGETWGDEGTYIYATCNAVDNVVDLLEHANMTRTLEQIDMWLRWAREDHAAARAELDRLPWHEADDARRNYATARAEWDTLAMMRDYITGRI